ncbi:hypothetical protein [Tropicibacter alexandrii]|uniref:hypothetical protein n=1 Tax=Tropicibacter alexandrii TaxID=2267683 RepID=UPI001008CBA8|nr:hypothetical protein [Tropicibacter alexandrii]
MRYTLGQAAKATGKSKTTIQRAVSTAPLVAVVMRDNHGNRVRTCCGGRTGVSQANNRTTHKIFTITLCRLHFVNSAQGCEA